ncbi:MAG: NAD(P)H-dependent oxidoreductase [Actinomycetes bacterium]|jgi:hypothetical protein|nr:NAD(P)H-dependent oxidoreductase [Actinomycetes bacterium]
MNIIALDAARGSGAVSQSLEAAARAAEGAGAQVTRLQLRDYRIYDCVNCKLCALGDGCKIDDDLQELSILIAQADGVILGADAGGGANSGSSSAVSTLLRRLRTWFEADKSQPPLPGLGPHELRPEPLARATKQAIIITSARSAGPIGAFFNTGGGHIRTLRSALAACHINALGSMEVHRVAPDSILPHREWDRAHSLGRLIAGKL